MSNVQVPQTKFFNYTNRELVKMYDQYKDDPEYTIELKHRLEKVAYR